MLPLDSEDEFQGDAPIRYVLSLNGEGSFAVLGPGRELKEKTARIESASHFDSMSEATMSAFLAGLKDFTVQPHAA